VILVYETKVLSEDPPNASIILRSVAGNLARNTPQQWVQN